MGGTKSNERKKPIIEDDKQPEEPTKRGIVLMSNIPELATKFNNIARKQRFAVANKSTN